MNVIYACCGSWCLEDLGKIQKKIENYVEELREAMANFHNLYFEIEIASNRMKIWYHLKANLSGIKKRDLV